MRLPVETPAQQALQESCASLNDPMLNPKPYGLAKSTKTLKLETLLYLI